MTVSQPCRHPSLLTEAVTSIWTDWKSSALHPEAFFFMRSDSIRICIRCKTASLFVSEWVVYNTLGQDGKFRLFYINIEEETEICIAEIWKFSL